MTANKRRVGLIVCSLTMGIIGCRGLGTGFRFLHSASDLEYLFGDSVPEKGLNEHINGSWSFVLLYSVTDENVDEWRKVYMEIGEQADRIWPSAERCPLTKQINEVAGISAKKPLGNFFATCSPETVKKYINGILGRGQLSIVTYLDNGTIFLRGTDGTYEDIERPCSIAKLKNTQIGLERRIRKKTVRRLKKLVCELPESGDAKPKFELELMSQEERIGRVIWDKEEARGEICRVEEKSKDFVPVRVESLMFVPWVHMPIHQNLVGVKEPLNVEFRLSMTPCLDGKELYWVGEIVGYKSTKSYGMFLAWRQ